MLADPPHWSISECMESPRGAEVEPTSCQKASLEEQTMSTLRVKLKRRAHKEEDQDSGRRHKEGRSSSEED